MQQVLVRAGAACVVIACAAGAWSETAFMPAGWNRVLGAGSVALLDAAAPFDNPAGLAAHDAFSGSASYAFATPGDAQSAGLVVPVDRASGFGVAFGRDEAAGTRAWGLGAGRSWGGFGVGGAVMLRAAEDAAGTAAASHGATLGARWRAPGAALWSAGAVLDDAVRSGAPAVRRLRAAVAWSPAARHAWRATATLGVTTAPDAPAGVTPGILLQHGSRYGLACGWSDDAAHAGAAVRHGTWTLGYAFTAGGDPRHGLVLHVGFGAARAVRDAQARRRAEADIDSACAARQETQVASWLAAANAAASAGAHARAATLYRNVLGWRPEHPEAVTGLATAERAELLQRADSLAARQELWAASGMLERAHELFPSDSLVTVRLRNARAAIGDAARTRNDATQRFTAGVEAYAAQDFAAAALAFETVLDLDPAHSLAGEFLQRARTARENQHTIMLGEARNLLERGEYEAAGAALDRIVSPTPDDPEIARIRVRIEREREREIEARRRLEAERFAAARREDRAPTPPAPRDLAARYDRGMQLYRSGDLVGALGDWEVVARHDTAYGDVGQYLLRVYRVCGLERYTEGQLQQAIALWDKALQLEPDNSQLKRYRAQAEVKLRRAQPPGGRP